MTLHDPRPPAGPGCSRRGRRGGQAAEVVVAQAIEHQFGELPGGGDDSDVAAAAAAHLVADLTEAGACGGALHGLDRPAHQA
jgi:hypothetical protein